MSKIGATSLFSSAGIGTLFVDKEGISINTSNELIDKRACLHRYLYPNCESITGDIWNDSVFERIVESHTRLKNQILFATPPCQGMSLAGKRKVNDRRNLLITRVVEFIKRTKPKIIFIENVMQLYSTKINVDGNIILITDYLKNELKDEYQYFNFFKVNAKDFNTAQDRKRAIIVISNCDFQLPPPSNEITVYDVIRHLPSLESGEKSNIPYHNAPVHNPNHILFMKHTPTGKTAFENSVHYPKKKDGTRIKGFMTTYKRISWDKPAPTITMANGSISSQNNVHPGWMLENGMYSDARVLTVKEIMLLSGLADDFTLPKETSETLIRQIIGECVPPKIFEGIIKYNFLQIKKMIGK
ncbi:DNA cytosine methyltransferase [Ureaplasma canigenitalium]|uniref:DNA cytosine methyltransferase n=1 Tax=Ureaplasma canigenitalium TaxID=42092 RepID=UPI0004E0DCC3|nr:DNA cytosine methyltransferase [Ureaplasma canigenitalium]